MDPTEKDKYKALGIPRPAPKTCLKPAGKSKGKGKRSAKLVGFRDAKLATCLETGFRVEPVGGGEDAKQRFQAAHRKLKDRKLKARDSKELDIGVTEAPRHNKLPPRPVGAKTGLPRSVVLNARLDKAGKNANALSGEAFSRGYMDFAFYVCKWGSKQHRNLTILQAKFKNFRFGSFEGTEKEHAIDGGGELVSLSQWYHDIGTAMSEPRTRTRWELMEYGWKCNGKELE